MFSCYLIKMPPKKKIVPTLVEPIAVNQQASSSVFNAPIPLQNQPIMAGDDAWYKKKEESSNKYLTDLIHRIESGSGKYGESEYKKAYKVDKITKIGKKKKKKVLPPVVEEKKALTPVVEDNTGYWSIGDEPDMKHNNEEKKILDSSDDDSEVKMNKKKTKKNSLDTKIKAKDNKWKSLKKQNEVSGTRAKCKPNETYVKAHCRRCGGRKKS